MLHVYFNYSSCVFHVCFLAAKADQERTISFRKWDSLYEPFMLYKSKASLDMFIWVKKCHLGVHKVQIGVSCSQFMWGQEGYKEDKMGRFK